MKKPSGAFAVGLALLLVHGAPATVRGGQALAPTLADAKPGDVRLIATAAIRFPDAVVAAAEKAIGKKLVIQYGSARGNLKDTILKGQEFEVAILLPDVNEEIFKAGKILPETHEIARVPIAFGLRGEAPGLDVSTPEAVRSALLKAKSVKYAPTGAALLTVKKVFSVLDIADKVQDSSTARAEVPLGPGEYEINIYPISEIIPNKALKNLGPVIAPLQVPSILQTVIGAHANDQKAARALTKFLQGPAIDETLKTTGMTKSVVDGTLK